ncbi:MAG TPA: rhodanese-like domain-containing protein [Blastocatellia bacterium]|nr:rhodanese-like domain-containing protein [Blastocatellia bacterium]
MKSLTQSFEAHSPTPAHTEIVVSPAWVKTMIDRRSPVHRRNRFVVLEASWARLAEAGDYLAGHIPGALHLDTDEFENGYPRWLLRQPRELQRVIGALGIPPATTVVVYGRQTIAAARAWWVLKYAGVADVRFLNGGLAAWRAAGYPVETTINLPEPVVFEERVRDEWLATTAYVRTHLNDRQTRLADVRSLEEYIGASSGYNYINFKGRIPAAIHIDNADDTARLYVGADGALRDADEILALWQRAGLTDDGSEVIFYCGNGWRSSLAFLYARVLGFKRIRNYSDGWGGWSTVYTPDPRADGNTPGWRQRPSANPFLRTCEGYCPGRLA